MVQNEKNYYAKQVKENFLYFIRIFDCLVKFWTLLYSLTRPKAFAPRPRANIYKSIQIKKPFILSLNYENIWGNGLVFGRGFTAYKP